MAETEHPSRRVEASQAPCYRDNSTKTTSIAPIEFAHGNVRHDVMTGTIPSAPVAGTLLESRRELPSLTGLRGICAFCVVLGHFDFRDVSPVFGAALWHNAAVDIFFVLSGFTMFYVHGPERGPLDVRDFVARRIARLWPLCLATLLFVLLPFWKHASVTHATPASMTFAIDFIRQALMINCWPIVGSGIQYNGPQWSASVEFLLYLSLFPILFRFTHLVRGARPGLIGLIVMVLMAVSTAAYLLWFTPALMEGGFVADPTIALASLTIRGVCGFTAGFLTYYYCVERRSIEAEGRCADALSILIILILIGATFSFWSHQTIALLAPAIIVCSLSGRSFTKAVLHSRLLHHIGIISYSLYLVHVPLLWYVTTLLNQINKVVGSSPLTDLPGRVLTLVLIIPASTLSYRLIEAPARVWLYQRLGRPRASGLTVPAA